jgi:hypothetical protein
MKIRELKKKAGSAVMSAWPPSWGGSYGRGDRFPMGEQGILVAVERQGDYLSLTIEYEGKKHSGGLQWDAPPSLDDVENVLKAHRGELIKAISELDI